MLERATRKKQAEVANAKRLTSRTFLMFVFTNLFLRTPSLAWTVTSRAPIIPVILPIMRAAGRSFIGEYSWVRFPNLSTAAPLRDITLPLSILVRNARVSVLTAEVKKTSQRVLKVQKVVGFDISYANKAPPIGDPKAALTPAAAPAAMNVLLS